MNIIFTFCTGNRLERRTGMRVPISDLYLKCIYNVHSTSILCFTYVLRSLSTHILT